VAIIKVDHAGGDPDSRIPHHRRAAASGSDADPASERGIID
jgi:hypothetical protein